MNPRLLGLLILLSLPSAAPGQGGWVSSVNPGFVGPPLAGALAPPVTAAHPNRIHIRRGPVVVRPASPAARLSSPQQVPTGGTDGVSIVPRSPDVLVYPVDTRFTRGVHPYVLTPGLTGQIVTRFARTHETQAGMGDGLFIGMARADVIERLGRPSATIYESSGQETLFFTNATILIQNGFVAVIQ